ncbi:MAG: LLM class F420-dependent oxidoreductase [Deltaproteobacteria bacterium]|nr:LLM class F420-dependent oxidoreductase [Deltaproteobacteria bacterium]
MKFALQAVGCGSTAKPEVLAEVATRAEALGFESLWIPEHLAVPLEMRSPYPYSSDGKFPGGAGVALHDPFVALAFAAAKTSTIRLGTGVFVVPLRNAIAVAKAVASLDVLSNGRFLFGVGIGWLQDEFEAVGMPFEHRAARTREAIRMMKTLWREEAPSFAGRFHQFPPLGFGPKPVQQPHPPIILGGESPAALKRAAEIGDGWIGVAHTPQSAAAIVATLRERRAAAGRGGEPFEITVGPAPGVRLDRDSVRAFADAGVDRLFTFAPGFVPRGKLSSELFPAMEQFARDVMR